MTVGVGLARARQFARVKARVVVLVVFEAAEERDGARWSQLLRDRPGWIARHRWSTTPADRRELSVRHAHLRGRYQDGRDRRPTPAEREHGVPEGWLGR